MASTRKPLSATELQGGLGHTISVPPGICTPVSKYHLSGKGSTAGEGCLNISKLYCRVSQNLEIFLSPGAGVWEEQASSSAKLPCLQTNTNLKEFSPLPLFSSVLFLCLWAKVYVQGFFMLLKTTKGPQNKG